MRRMTIIHIKMLVNGKVREIHTLTKKEFKMCKEACEELLSRFEVWER